VFPLVVFALQKRARMHLVDTTEVTGAGPRWAHAPEPTSIPATARAITIGLARSTVVVIESRDAQRDAPGEVLRTRHVGMVRMIASDGVVVARRRLVSGQGNGDVLISHLLDEVRAAVTAAPHLVVGLVQDAGDATWAALQHGLRRLADEGAIHGWIEAVDRGALRGRLERTLCVIEPSALARDERLDHWDACLDAWDDAIDGVTSFLRPHRGRRAVDAQLAYLEEHRARLRYVALRRAGLNLRTPREPDREELGYRPRMLRAG